MIKVITLTVKKLQDLILSPEKTKQYLNAVKRESDKLDLTEFRTVVNSRPGEYASIDLCEYWESFEELACSDACGYDYRVFKNIEYEFEKILRAIGIAYGGDNKLFNKLFSWLNHLLEIAKTEEEREYWQQWVDFLKELNLVRIEIKTVLVRVGLR